MKKKKTLYFVSSKYTRQEKKGKENRKLLSVKQDPVKKLSFYLKKLGNDVMKSSFKTTALHMNTGA